MKKLLLCLYILSLTACVRQQSTDFSLFTRQVEQIRQDYRNTGLALAIVKDNSVYYSEGFGNLTPQSLVRIASISKSFTGVGIMQQVEAGRLSLQDDVSTLLGFSVHNPLYPDTPITLEHLLSHTSSLNDTYSSIDDLNPALNSDYAQAYNTYAPGQGYCYCDYNITLAGTILERTTGERFDNCIRSHILRPLHIDGDYNLDSLDQKRIAKLYYVTLSDTTLVLTEATGAYNQSARFSPASGMKLSLEGLTHWMLFLMNDSIAVDMMRTRYPSYHNYGLTLLHSADYSDTVTLTGHKGGAYGMRSAFYFHPEEKYGFVVISSGALNSPLPAYADDEALRINRDSLYLPDGEGDTSIRVPLLRLMFKTLQK